MKLRLLDRLLSAKPAAAWRDHQDKFNDKVARLNSLLSDAVGGAEVATKARDAFYANPSAATASNWVDAEINRTAFSVIQGQHGGMQGVLRDAHWAEGASLLQAAITEAESSLRDQLQKISDDDQARGEDLGVNVQSHEALAKIDAATRHLGIAQARLEAGDFIAAGSHYSSALK